MLASNGKESNAMRYLSVCSGIEAATVAWHDMGWQAAAYSEIEKFPSEVLKYHYPSVPNMGDMTKYKEWEIGTIGLLVGGTPCQSFSVAGLRKGLTDPRGNLALTYCGILDHFRPKWFIWENVPGVLSSNKGRDFGSFLGAVVELGYGFSYRVLDAQHFGVAQRRRRVFVVGHFGDWRPSAKVLFESHSLSGNPKKSRQKGETATTFVESSFGTFREDRIGGTTKASGGVLGGGSETLVYENHGTDSRIKPVEISPTVTARWGTGGNNVPLAHAFKVRGGCEGSGKGYLGQDEKAFTLSTLQDQQIAVGFNTNARPDEMKFLNEQSNTLTTSQNSGIFQNMAVRRLTEIECERLQGFPDNYTNIKENCPSGARYKALGNSMAVPVMRWIGNRIQMVEDGLI
jgi:DNA (cytosine-5)-methyltransferase 1